MFSLLAALELVGELSGQVLDRQRAGVGVVGDVGTEQVRLKADRQTFGAAGETAELVERALIGRDFRG